MIDVRQRSSSLLLTMRKVCDLASSFQNVTNPDELFESRIGEGGTGATLFAYVFYLLFLFVML